MVDVFGAVRTPHLYWLTPTYPGDWVVDWRLFKWGSASYVLLYLIWTRWF